MRSRAGTTWPGRRRAGLAEEHERHRPLPQALLVALGRHHDRIRVGRVERRRQALSREQRLDLLAQLRRPGEPQRREQAERDRLAVAVLRVPGRGLDRVADGVPEVEDLAQAAVPLVLGDDPELRPRAVDDHRRIVRRRPAAHPLPQRAAGDQRRLDHLGVPGGELLRRKRAQRRGVDEHRRWLVVGADVVLRLREVDAGLAPVGRVDLRDERRRDLDEADAALVGGGAEAGEIADDATAEGDDHVLAGHAAAGELGPHDLGVGDRLRLLAGHDRDAPVERLERVAVQVPDAPVGDEEAASGHDRRRPEAEEPRTDEHRVVARRTRRPQQRGVRR